jgi:pyruvate kinase
MGDAYAHQSFGRTRAEWIANLDTEYTPKAVFRRTSIICTIGTYKRFSFLQRSLHRK